MRTRNNEQKETMKINKNVLVEALSASVAASDEGEGDANELAAAIRREFLGMLQHCSREIFDHTYFGIDGNLDLRIESNPESRCYPGNVWIETSLELALLEHIEFTPEFEESRRGEVVAALEKLAAKLRG